MVKDTVRYPDGVVEQIESLVRDSPVESKSEFYRFSAELALSLVEGDYEPEMFHFDDLREELGIDLTPAEPAPRAESQLLEALITVRRHCLRGDFEAAEAFLDEQCVDIDRETMLLEEVLALYRERDGGASSRTDGE